MFPWRWQTSHQAEVSPPTPGHRGDSTSNQLCWHHFWFRNSISQPVFLFFSSCLWSLSHTFFVTTLSSIVCKCYLYCILTERANKVSQIKIQKKNQNNYKYRWKGYLKKLYNGLMIIHICTKSVVSKYVCVYNGNLCRCRQYHCATQSQQRPTQECSYKDIQSKWFIRITSNDHVL